MVNDIKKTVKKTVRENHSEANVAHLCGLLKQGDFLNIILQEKQDATWQSNLHNLKKGTMKLILNASINTLPTQDNLKLWNKFTCISVLCVVIGTVLCTHFLAAKLHLTRGDLPGAMTTSLSILQTALTLPGTQCTQI